MNALRVFLALLLPFTLLSALSNICFGASEKPFRFSIKLIHKYSQESPFYPGKNLTFGEFIDRYSQDSRLRSLYLMSKLSPENKDIRNGLLTPEIYSFGFMYVALVRIGTPGRYFYLILDTGSDLNWVLCEPRRGFELLPKREIYFNPYRSDTYKNVTCNDHQCLSCDHTGNCMFHRHYADNSNAIGVLARDSIGFMAPKDKYITFKRILFGCANPKSTHTTITKTEKTLGIMGMSSDPDSMTSQLAHYTGGRFSHCFVPPTENDFAPSSFLKFNYDMGYKGPYTKSTPFVKHPNGFYHLNLLDISVNSKRLRYPPGTFKIQNGGLGGFIIDSGTSVTSLRDNSYWRLHDAVKPLIPFQLVRADECPGAEYAEYGIQLCYHVPADLEWNSSSYPSITLHFENADYVIKPEQAFIFHPVKRLLLFAFHLMPEHNILGAWQQQNKRIVYDNTDNKLYFNDENCAKDVEY